MELLMSQGERDRLKVVHELVRGRKEGRRLTQAQAGALLGLSERQVRRVVRRYQAEGDAGLMHRSRGQPSNRKAPAAFRAEVLRLVEERYKGFGATLASEKLAEHEGLVVNRQTLRRWLIEAGQHEPRRRKVEAHPRRERRSCFGELVQMDTSIHDWFEGRGEAAVLISMIDDATSWLRMRFYPSDTTEANLTELRAYLLRWGRPGALYADKASHFTTTRSRFSGIEEQLEGRKAQTQIERALGELGIEYIPAHSPQAKGRVERTFDTAQDRLVKELRLRQIATIKEANEFLESYYLPLCNARFTVEPAAPLDAHRSVEGFDLDAICSLQETRAVANDYTIRYHNQTYQITQRPLPAGLRHSRVIVERRLDASLHLRWKNRYLAFQPIPTRANREASTPPTTHTPRCPVKPAANHPWRRGYPQREAARRAAVKPPR